MHYLIQKIFKANKLIVLTAVIFEKLIPFMVSFYFIKFMSDFTFGEWVIYLQLSFIGQSLLFTSLEIEFNNTFKPSEKHSINNLGILLISGLIFSIIAVISTESLSIIRIGLLLISLFSLGISSFILNMLRFENQHQKYLLSSTIRLILFVSLLLLNKYNITLNYILSVYIFSNITVLIINRKRVSFKLQRLNLQSTFKITLYAGLTMFVGGIEKISGVLSTEEVAKIAYIMAFIQVPSVLVEATKKYFIPLIYKDLVSLGRYSRETKKTIFPYLIGIVIVQLFGPYLVFLVIDFIGGIKDTMLSNDFFPSLFILNIGITIYNLYHFINPKFFYFKKTGRLVLIFTFVISVFYISNYFITTQKIEHIAIIKSSILILVVFLSYLFQPKKLWKKNIISV